MKRGITVVVLCSQNKKLLMPGLGFGSETHVYKHWLEPPPPSPEQHELGGEAAAASVPDSFIYMEAGST